MQVERRRMQVERRFRSSASFNHLAAEQGQGNGEAELAGKSRARRGRIISISADALGPEGEPTRDPTAARRGALLPFGGYKGFGLALMMQALGLLAGSGSDAESDYGYLFVAFRPDLFGPADTFERQVTQLIERIKATPRQPGVDDIRIPSERAFRSRERALREGLEIDRVVFDALVALRTR
jgi:LDH2 family malate/lactate/ureidoglycolate dehydrogenase